MPYQLTYHPKIKNDLASLPQNVKERIRNAIETRLLIDPVHYGDYLRGSLKGYQKLRVGDYRVIYKIVKNDIRIFKIGHRRDIYEKALLRE